MMELTPEELNNIKELAEKATPGPWRIYPAIEYPGALHVHSHGVCQNVCKLTGKSEYSVIHYIFGLGKVLVNSAKTVNKNNAAYIAAASPDVVLAMIAKIRQLENMVLYLSSHLEYACYRTDKDNCFTEDRTCPVYKNIVCNMRGEKTCQGSTSYGWTEAALKATESESGN